MLDKIPKNKKVILFDGYCNLCNSTVQIILKNDVKNEFVFTSLDSQLGKEIQQYLGIPLHSIDSIVLYIPNKAYYIKSEAAIHIFNRFNKYRFLAMLANILPEFVRDFLYDFIAKNRYQWFGKQEKCMIPTKETLEKFL